MQPLKAEDLLMKSYKSRILLCSLLGCSLASVGVAQGPRGRPGAPPPDQPPVQAGMYTTISGKVSQFNYDRNADVEGFLLNSNTLVHLPPRAAARIESTVHTGDTVQVAGLAQTAPSGFQTVIAQSVQDRTSGKSLTMPQPGPAAPYSGSGRIQQLNYGPDGAVNGFLLDNGTLATVPPFAATNPSSVRVGAQITYSGYARNTASGRSVVDIQNLSINGQTLTMQPRGGPGAPPIRPGGAVAPPPLPPGPASAAAPAPPASTPAPAGRTDQPPPPPPPAQPPQS